MKDMGSYRQSKNEEIVVLALTNEEYAMVATAMAQKGYSFPDDIADFISAYGISEKR